MPKTTLTHRRVVLPEMLLTVVVLTAPAIERLLGKIMAQRTGHAGALLLFLSLPLPRPVVTTLAPALVGTETILAHLLKTMHAAKDHRAIHTPETLTQVAVTRFRICGTRTLAASPSIFPNHLRSLR